jgi:bla regulator protein BlaR1
MKRPLPLLALALSLGLTLAAPCAPATDSASPLAPRFAGYDAAFLLLDARTGAEVRFGEAMLKRRASPCSTFKIPNALVALETGVVPDADTTVAWDGKERVYPSWNADQSLRTGMKFSTLWLFQEMARRVGELRMTEWVRKLGYGNMDTSGGLDRFWLSSSLKVSPEEQVAFLLKLHRETLPLSARTIRIVKEITTLADDGTTVFRGKTGTSGRQPDGSALGWFVGWVTRGADAWVFATRIESKGEASEARGPKAREITEAILRERGILR